MIRRDANGDPLVIERLAPDLYLMTAIRQTLDIIIPQTAGKGKDLPPHKQGECKAVEGPYVIASEAKQSPMLGIEIASSLPCKGGTSCYFLRLSLGAMLTLA